MGVWGMPEGFSQDALVLCFDYGLKRIGVAVGNLLTKSSRPLSVIHWTKNKNKWEEVLEFVHSWEPDVVVVGVPFHPDGKPNSMTAVCRNFGKDLQKRISVPVVYEDERYSSVEAQEYTQDDEIDDVAACVILEQWLQRAGKTQ
jgi:putative Holliday junction resolvase